jgi:hypothetical protein
MANEKIPTTRHQKGKRWATYTLLICGAFSIWANVRSGQMNYESVIVSVFPPIVAFATSHLISYFNPRKTGHRVLIWGIGGIVLLFAMYGSGWHIWDYVIKTGQHWTTGIAYIFITDVPMLLAAVILVEKVSTAQQATSPAKAVKTDIAASTVKAPVKAQKAVRPAKAATPPKRTSPAKPAVAFKTPDIMSDPLEKAMLNA